MAQINDMGYEKLLGESKNCEHYDLILTFPIVHYPTRRVMKPQTNHRYYLISYNCNGWYRFESSDRRKCVIAFGIIILYLLIQNYVELQAIRISRRITTLFAADNDRELKIPRKFFFNIRIQAA